MDRKMRDGESEPLAAPLPWGPRTRAAVSLLLALHVMAVFVAPWSAPPPASELSRIAARQFEPYLFGAFLNHGYRFFAPNPGPSHLVEYELEFADGRSEVGRFPDVQQHWPRLLYHRHLMLAETVNQFSDVPPQPERPASHLPPGVKQQALAEYRQAQAVREQAVLRRDLLLESVAGRLLKEHGAAKVRLWSIEHAILPPEAILAGERMDREDTYWKRPLGEFPPPQDADEELLPL